MAITMIKQEKLLAEEFFDSGMWDKLKSLVFCAVEWSAHNDTTSKFLEVTSFDFQTDETLINEIKADYDFIRNKLKTQGFGALTGKDGKWIQARTKGAGHGSTSRAFYARKELVSKIFNSSKQDYGA
jgi:hypothetical protein